MEPDRTDTLRPQVRIPAARVTITRQYIVEQALKVLGAGVCEVTDLEWNMDEFLFVVSMDIPPHGDIMVSEKEKKFYGEPMGERHEAVESAYAAALHYLQKMAIVVIDDANLLELKSCQRSLLEATSWAGFFEMMCTSQKAKISVMAEQIQLLTFGAPPSPPSDDYMVHEVVDEGLPMHHTANDYINDFVVPGTESPLTLQSATAAESLQNTPPPMSPAFLHADADLQLSPSSVSNHSSARGGTSYRIVQRSLVL